MPDADDLPEEFRRIRAADEAFWAQQERQMQGAAGQPCCTLSGFSTALMNLPGNFAVVVHGEDECSACFYHFGPSAHQFFCTGLTERHFVTGETAAPLDECLRLVATELDPEAIFVLGACPIEVIGDRFETVVAAVAADFPHIPMMPLHTSGLKVGSQAAMLDWLFSTLASLPAQAPTDSAWVEQMGQAGLAITNSWLNRDAQGLQEALQTAHSLPGAPAADPARCLNFVGLPQGAGQDRGDAEWGEPLRAAGLELVGNFPYGVTLDDWRAIRFARATFTVDRSLYPKLVTTLEQAGQEVIEVPLPVGVSATTRFYEAIARRYDAEQAITGALAAAREHAQAAVDAFRIRHGGTRIAIGLRMLNNYETDQLASHGLGDYHLFVELGFVPTLLIQGPPEKKERFARLFERHGIGDAFEMFSEPWDLAPHLGGDRYDICYMADHARTEARKAGVPHLVSREFAPFYAGVAENLRYVASTLESR